MEAVPAEQAGRVAPACTLLSARIRQPCLCTPLRVRASGSPAHALVCRFEFLQHSPILAGQLRYETEFEWGGTRIFVTSAVVENLRVW